MKLSKTIKNYLSMKKSREEVLKTTFLSLISHEIKTPMNGIVGFTSMLESNKSLDHDAQTYIQIIKDSCLQLQAVLDNIVEVGKLKSGDIKCIRYQFNLHELLFEVGQALHYLAEEKGNTIRIDVDGSMKEINSDRNKLKQIFYNLCQNALLNTTHGTVTLGYKKEDGGHITYYVEDTGVGISKEDQSKIFKDFLQVDNSLTRKQGGLGVGLSIAKAYVDLLHGKMSIQSTPGKGSRFAFSIPE